MTYMEEMNHGEVQEAQGAQDGQESQVQEVGTAGNAGADFEKMLAERDEQIAQLQEQVAAASKSAETADELRGQIEELKAQAEAEREEFALRSAGCRSVKAARALLGDHGGDVAALKEAEPWLFSEASSPRKTELGTTGLKPTGAATEADATVKRWRRIAGLED